MLPVRELPAHDGVTVERRSPEGDEHIHRDQRVEVVGARLPALGELGLAAVREVAQIADRQQRAFDGRRRQLCDIRLPIAIVAGSERQPPGEYGRKGHEDSDGGPPPGTDQGCGESGDQEDTAGERSSEGTGFGSVDPERSRRP